MHLLNLVIVLHIMAMVAALGTLLAAQFGVPARLREDAELRKGLVRLFTVLLGVGLLLGLAAYGIRQGHRLGGHYNGVIGLKFIILLVCGGLAPVIKKAARAELPRMAAIALLVVAALAASTLPV